MRRAVLAALAVCVGAAVFFTQWVRTVDPRPEACAPGPRTCRGPFEVGPHGRYDVAVSDDRCLRARLTMQLGRRRGFELYEVQADGGERPLLSETFRPDSSRWAFQCPPYELPPLPKYWWPAEERSVTWYGDGERVERRVEQRGRVVRETRSVLEGGRWVVGPTQTHVLDLAPDKPPKFSPENQQY